MHRPQTDKTTFEEWGAVQAVQAHDKQDIPQEAKSIETKRNNGRGRRVPRPTTGFRLPTRRDFGLGIKLRTYIKSMEVGMMLPLLLPGPPISLSR